MELNPFLNLNKHPKDCENLSLISAKGMKLANDGSGLTNEEGLDVFKPITNRLYDYYGENIYNIVGIIPCNKELVIIVNTFKDYSDIFRFIEDTKELKLVYNKYKYNGGVVRGTYTYNVEGSLIIAIAEDTSHLEIKTPLKTINLGNINDANIANDLNLNDDNLSISPAVKIPIINNLVYLSGSAYKGWYYMFIRFKINTIDYTQWFNFAYPIYLDDIQPYQIVRYCFNQSINLASSDINHWLYNALGYPEGYGVGCSDSFSSSSDISNQTFSFSINSDNILYDQYQIGLICFSKSYSKAFRTSDLTKDVDNVFIFDSKQLIESSIEELTTENYNYFNVKNIINYNNRLYISNYEEQSANNNNIVKPIDDLGNTIIDNIKVSLNLSTIEAFPNVYSQIIGRSRDDTTTSSQYETTYPQFNGLPFNIYFNVNIDTKYRLTGFIDDQEITIEASAYDIIINTRDSSYPNFINIIVYPNSETSYVFEKVVTYTNLSENSKGVIDCDKFSIAGAIGYLQPLKNYNQRKIRSTLIPGEVYNFFIHYIDKYGHATNGYKLTNKDKRIISKDDNRECVPITYFINENDENIIHYAIFNIETKVSDINIETVEFYKNINYDGTFYNKIEDSNIIKIHFDAFLNQYINIIENYNFRNYKLYQIFNNGYTPFLNTDAVPIFGKHANNNNDILFKIPESRSTSFFDIYNIEVSNVQLPDDYIGYYISYEKFEPMKRVTGFLTRADFRTQSKIINNDVLLATDQSSNLSESDKMYFYSSKFDISDNLSLDYNILTITGKDTFEKREIQPYDYWQRNKYMTFPYDYNKPAFIKDNITRRSYSIPEYKLCPADSVKDDRTGLGTALQMKDSYNLFTSVPFDATSKDENIHIYTAEIANISNNLYMSKDKELIRLGEIIYGGDVTITAGYNGKCTYDGVIVYDNKGIIFNEADFKVRPLRGYNKDFYPADTENHGDHSYVANKPFLNYVQFPVYDDYFYESKSFNNEPTTYIFPIQGLNTESANSKTYFPGNIVEPKNSIDLFQNKQGSQDQFNPKIYTNYRNDLVNIAIFDKTIRRSNVIQDESRENAWRVFPVEGYRNIAENKGKITNLVGIGVYLLVHTEHSLFMFSRDASLKTEDRDIQLNQPDAFDVDYQEVFTSDFGYGGLQDSLSYIVDQFGYIFYNNNFKHLYKFDNGSLNIIDEDFYIWLEKYNPYNVRIANDKFNNRLLIKFEFDVKSKDEKGNISSITKKEVFSYNYNTDKLISGHDYVFEKAYNTETKLYITLPNNENLVDRVYAFDRLNNYGFVSNNIINNSKIGSRVKKYNGPYTESHISIILNVRYEVVKFLEYIKYKLRKVNKNHIYDYDYYPVEEQSVPYAGDRLRVYGDSCDTGEIDISINEINQYNQYTKPYFELGNWNYNYLRNNIVLHPTISDSQLSVIFGNYIVIKFTFYNDGELIEFEDFSPVIAKHRKQ